LVDVFKKDIIFQKNVKIISGLHQAARACCM